MAICQNRRVLCHLVPGPGLMAQGRRGPASTRAAPLQASTCRHKACAQGFCTSPFVTSTILFQTKGPWVQGFPTPPAPECSKPNPSGVRSRNDQRRSLPFKNWAPQGKKPSNYTIKAKLWSYNSQGCAVAPLKTPSLENRWFLRVQRNLLVLSCAYLCHLAPS